MCIAAIDIGGTKINGAAVNEKGQIMSFVRIENTGLSGEFILDTCKEIYLHLSEHHAVQLLAVGTGGRLDTETGKIKAAADLYTNYVGLNIKESLEESLGIPVAVDNDCCMALRGELWKGDLPDYQRVAGLSLGTGVGGGIAVKSNGFYKVCQAELGHFILHPDGAKCLCGQQGCVEQYLSGTSLWKRYNQRESLIKLESGYEFFEMVKKGDKNAIEILEEFEEDLAVCLISIQNLYDVEAVVIGGGLVDTKELWWDKVKELTWQKGSHVLPHLDIVPAKNGNYAALLGAAKLGFEKMEGI